MNLQAVLLLKSSLFMLYEPAPPQIISIDIIFFHGLQFEHNSDAYLSTWISGNAKQEVWPERWLPAKYPGARIVFVSYDAFIGTTGTEGMMDMYLIGENLLIEILWIRQKQGRECPVVLVGHSFGGLVIKQLCVHAYGSKETYVNGQGICEFLDSIGGIFFYGTPHRGINTATNLWKDSVMSSIPANKPLLSFVKLLDKGAARLHQDVEQPWKMYNWLIYGVGELHRLDGSGQHSLQVEEGSSRLGDHYITVECDHFSICRPVSETDNRYLHLVDLIVHVDKKSKDGRRNHENLFRNVVGVESMLAEVQKLLQQHTSLGFCGMGGVGKTTLAKLVFNTLSPTFEVTCFVSEVKLIQGDKEEVKEKIWKNMRLHGHSVPKRTCSDMWTEISEKKLLVVFDDIDKLEHVELLQEIADGNVSDKSRFITTSRDEEVLRSLIGTYIYTVPFLKHEVARELFIAHAFPALKVFPKHLEHSVEEVVTGCAGLPLTLEILGKYLRGERSVKIWDETLVAMRNTEAISCLEEKVWRSLQVSYDALRDSEKHMFLDDASFLLLKSCPFRFADARVAWSSMFRYVDKRWKILLDKSLVVQEVISDGALFDDEKIPRLAIDTSGMICIGMHEHLRRMGQRITKESGRYVSMMEEDDIEDDGHEWGDNSNRIQPEKVVALRVQVGAHFAFKLNGDMDRSFDSSCSPCQVQKFFSQLEAVRYLDLNMHLSLSCERCGSSGGFSLPKGLVMFRWRGSNVNVIFPLEAAICRSLVVLTLDRDDDCSLDILSPQACRRYLSRLERLTIASAKLMHLPDKFENLNRLEHLEIERCKLLERLPESFGNLGGLQHLKINSCGRLEGLPETFGNLGSLKHLEIRSCESLERLSETFGNLGSLQHLEISWFGSLEGLPETFGNLGGLQHLEINRCESLEGLPKTFGNLGSLQHLEISFCGRLKGLPETFGNLGGLQHLEISCCGSLKRLPETFGNLGGLQHLEISENENLKGLPETFGNLGDLQHLKINWCARLEGLPKTFGNLGSLKHLEIRFCETLKRLSETFGNLGGLQHLEISECRNLEGLSETFGNLGSLKYLKISSCGSLEGLLETFGNLGSLQHLEISENARLEGLPETFGKLGSLKHLEISGYGNLEGLPETFGNLGSLKHLEISRCGNLEGLSETFGNLGSLKYLKISSCGRLEGLPETFGNLGSLKHLEISRCGRLEGLPETFGNVGSLKHLEISSCGRLEGLPETFGNLDSLKHLEISSCRRLEGLRETFENLGNLQHLEICWCERLERLPETFGNLGGLKHLEISGCERLERLPETFGNLGSLKHLEISGCERLERLPETFGNLGGLKHLEINGCERLERLLETFGNLSSL